MMFNLSDFEFADYELALLDLISENNLEWKGNPNELIASYAADGYSRINGTPAAFVTTMGPGELSAYCGMAGHYCEYVITSTTFVTTSTQPPPPSAQPPPPSAQPPPLSVQPPPPQHTAHHLPYLQHIVHNFPQPPVHVARPPATRVLPSCPSTRPSCHLYLLLLLLYDGSIYSDGHDFAPRQTCLIPPLGTFDPAISE